MKKNRPALAADLLFCFSSLSGCESGTMNQDTIHRLIQAVSDRNIHEINQMSLGESPGRFWSQVFTAAPDARFDFGTPAISTSSCFLPAEVSLPGEKLSLKLFLQLLFSQNRLSACLFLGEVDFPGSVPQEVSHPASITGIGGIFIKSDEPENLCAWYDQHLGTSFSGQTYALFRWRERSIPFSEATTTFAFFPHSSEYFHPSGKKFMINFRVKHLDRLLEKLEAAGIHQIAPAETFDYGKFAWISDPEGNKIELWEAIDAPLEAYEDGQ